MLYISKSIFYIKCDITIEEYRQKLLKHDFFNNETNYLKSDLELCFYYNIRNINVYLLQTDIQKIITQKAQDCFILLEEVESIRDQINNELDRDIIEKISNKITNQINSIQIVYYSLSVIHRLNQFQKIEFLEQTINTGFNNYKKIQKIKQETVRYYKYFCEKYPNLNIEYELI